VAALETIAWDADAASIDHGLVELDIGIALQTATGHEVLVNAHGYALDVTVDGGHPEDLDGVVEETRLADRRSGSPGPRGRPPS
jgi:hypothetical protein